MRWEAVPFIPEGHEMEAVPFIPEGHEMGGSSLHSRGS